jgi:2-polyprenyl-6-hydroxyphenyl methylase/3-demethylubiquinone-9 3-methyltransferase
MSGITPCLWFDGNAEEAAKFYAFVFPNSNVDAVHRAPNDYRQASQATCCWSSSH